MKDIKDFSLLILGIVTIIWSAWKLGFIPSLNEEAMYWIYLVTGIIIVYARLNGL